MPDSENTATLGPDDGKHTPTVRADSSAERVDGPAEGSTLGRFRLDTLIGEGGMGRVFEAWDPRLRRRVAIKTLLLRDPESVRRFVREARLQGSVSHPGICQVYEVGDDPTSPYIVMQRLHGLPLDEAADGLNLEQKLVLIRRVAEAVHEAHRTGLIHRDLKPSNIMVEAEGSDPLRPVVLDFGIARDVGETEMTRAGDLVGTPTYMAPEQMLGEHLDRRADVYALGATLYRLLAGRPAFLDEGPATFLKVLNEEAPGLRSHGVPQDVEAIVFKCLEKEPRKRYGSARDLARDLSRYLEGEEVSARPVGPWHRLRKQLRRHRVVVAVAAVFTVLLTLALAWGAWTAQQAEQRERLARELTREVEEIEALVRYSHLSPLHDTRSDRQLLRRHMDEITRAMERAGRIGRGPGQYALGRGFLALDDLETAKNHLQEAWESGFREAEVGAALAQTLSALYRERLAEVELGGDWQARSHQVEELQKAYGHPARSFLAELEGSDELARPEASSEGALLRALALFHDDRFGDALVALHDSSSRLPWSYELFRLEGDILRTWAIRLDAERDAEGALEKLAAASEAYAEAAKIAESDPGVYRADAQAVFLRLSMELRAGSISGDALESALHNLDRAIRARPDDGETRLWQARLHRLAAQDLRRRALDPTARLEAAIAAAEQAREDPRVRSRAWQELGRAHWSRSQWLVEQGEDPAEPLGRALEAFAEVDPAQRSYSYWIALGMAHTTSAQHRISRGEAATEEFDHAAEAFHEATRRHSAPFAAWINLGTGLLRASSESTAGDSKELLHRAVEALEQAAALREDHVAPHYYLGLSRLRLAQGGYSGSGRLDPETARRAEEDLQRALALAPDMFQLHSVLGELAYYRGIQAWEQGSDPRSFFDEARRRYGRSAELAPESIIPIHNSALLEMFRARMRLAEDRDPEAPLNETEHLFRRIPQAQQTAGARIGMANTALIRGEWKRRNGLEPEPEFQRALELLGEILEGRPGQIDACRISAQIWIKRAQHLAGVGKSPEPAFEQARLFMQKALRSDPNNTYSLLAEAERLEARAGWLHDQNRSTEAEEAARRGLAAISRARSLRPEWRRLEPLESALRAFTS